MGKPRSAEDRARQAEMMRAKWQDPEYRAARSGKPGTPQAQEARARQAAKMREKWKDPEYRAAVLAKLNAPEVRARIAEKSRTPESRAKRGTIRKAFLDKYGDKEVMRAEFTALRRRPEFEAARRAKAETPEHRANLSEAHRRWHAENRGTPEYKARYAKIAEAQRSYQERRRAEKCP